MRKFPNKVIAEAYEAAKGKVFTKRSDTGEYFDSYQSNAYNHVAMQWLEDRGIIARSLNRKRYVFEYRVVK